MERPIIYWLFRFYNLDCAEGQKQFKVGGTSDLRGQKLFLEVWPNDKGDTSAVNTSINFNTIKYVDIEIPHRKSWSFFSLGVEKCRTSSDARGSIEWRGAWCRTTKHQRAGGSFAANVCSIEGEIIWPLIKFFLKNGVGGGSAWLLQFVKFWLIFVPYKTAQYPKICQLDEKFSHLLYQFLVLCPMVFNAGGPSGSASEPDDQKAQHRKWASRIGEKLCAVEMTLIFKIS